MKQYMIVLATLFTCLVQFDSHTQNSQKIKPETFDLDDAREYIKKNTWEKTTWDSTWEMHNTRYECALHLFIEKLSKTESSEDCKRLTLLLKAGANANCECKSYRSSDPRGSTTTREDFRNHVLLEAIRKKRSDIVKVLLIHGSRHKLALYNALKSRQSEIVHLILQETDQSETDWNRILYGLNLDKLKEYIDDGLPATVIRTSSGSNLLHQVCTEGKLDFVLYLIEKGADPDTLRNGKTPIDVAKAKGHRSVVEALELLKKYRKPRIHDMVFAGDMLKVRILLSAGVSVNEKSDTGCGQTPLHVAVEQGHVDLVDYLLSQSCYVNTRDNHRRTPLHEAARRGSLTLIQKLVKAGCDIDPKDNEGGATPLFHAAAHCPNCVALLHAHGAVLHSSNKCEKTTLHCAALSGNLATVEILLAGCHDDTFREEYINRTTVAKESVLHFAALSKSVAMVKFFIDCGVLTSTKNAHGRSPLHCAAEVGCHEMIDLLDYRKSTTTDYQDKKGTSPLHIAAKRGHESFAEELIRRSFPIDCIDSQQRLPLHYAVEEGFLEVVKSLLKPYITKDASALTDEGRKLLNRADCEGRSPLHLACQQKHLQVATYLISFGANVNVNDAKNRTPLHESVIAGDYNITKLLIDNKADYTNFDADGESPLSLAHAGNNPSLIELFPQEPVSETSPVSPAQAIGHLQLKAMQSYQAQEGDTPLHMALSIGNPSLIKALIESGQDINTANKLGIFPLHLAVKLSNTQGASQLITAKAEVNARDNEEQTPLHYAAQEGNLNISKHLIQAGAQAQMENKRKLTPFHLAALAQHRDVVKFLANILCSSKK